MDFKLDMRQDKDEHRKIGKKTTQKAESFDTHRGEMRGRAATGTHDASINTTTHTHTHLSRKVKKDLTMHLWLTYEHSEVYVVAIKRK
jgi:general stress protein 26